MSIVDQLQQSEYTGENRCMPCTAVNVAIAAVGGTLVTKAKSRVLGTAAFGVSLGTIYLRGYLVPGTPQLTKRYLPDQVLHWFEKEPMPASANERSDINPERVLLDAGTVTPCENGTDLCLTDEFRSKWHDQMHAAREQNNHDESALRNVLDVRDEVITFEEYGNALLAYTDDGVIGQWNSSAAITADITAANALAGRCPDWLNMTPTGRARVLASLRIFVDTCPECGGPVRIQQEAVESCCRSYDVLLSACEGCDATLFEVEWTEEYISTASDEQLG